MAEYRQFVGPNGEKGPLLNDVAVIKPRDTGFDDVREAWNRAKADGHRYDLADELGHDGVSAMEGWDRRISEIGPNAALEAANLYASAPRSSPPKEDERDEDDHAKAARAAFRSVAEKEGRQAALPATLAGLDRLQQRHGSLDVISDFKRWDSQLRENPQDAAARIAAEINDRINDGAGMYQAHQTLSAYEKNNKISADERPVMIRMLQSGEATSLAEAHRAARHELALEIADPHVRAVTASQRAADAMPLHYARQTVAEWDAAHPNVSGATRSKMQKLLAASKAQDLDEAYAMATGRR
jgi:hypothetical protein